MHEKIQIRAYKLWQEAGSPEGDGSEFWFQAENELKKFENLNKTEFYRYHILSSLQQKDLPETPKECLSLIGEQIQPFLSEEDFKEVDSGNIRWRKGLSSEKYRLVQEGIVERKKWQLTQKGEKFSSVLLNELETKLL